MIRVTIACPEAMVADANQFAVCIGLGPDDVNTYRQPVWEDLDGHKYAVASAVVSGRFVAVASSELTEPPWGADMPAARRAQAALRVIAPSADPDAPPPDPRATPDAIVAVIHEETLVAISMLGIAMPAVDPLSLADSA